jgi:hypothetical protein
MCPCSFGNGDGTFQAAVNHAAGDGAIAAAVADLDGLHGLDLVVANYYANTVTVLLDNGDGSMSRSDYAVASRPRGVAAADLDGDGWLDVVTANESGNNVSVLLGTGGGAFAARVDYASGAGANRVAIADLDGDGKLDLVVANRNAHTLTVLKGDGDGSFALPVPYSTGSNTYPRDVILADLDGDGHLDAATANYYGLFSLLRGHGDGTFTPASGGVYGGSSYDAYQIVAEDLDGDGDADLAVAAYGANRMYVMLNRGGDLGDFEPASGYNPGGNPIGVAAADVNVDGRLDLVTANHTDHTARVYLGNASKPLPEDPADSGLYSGYGRGNLWSTSDHDYFSFTAAAGQTLSLAAEVPGNPNNSGLFYDIRKPDGDRLTYFYADRYGWGQSSPMTLPVSGTYSFYVRYNYDYQGEYRVRVTLSDPPLQWETEDNGSTGNADAPVLSANGAHQQAMVAGYVSTGDSGDYYLLGNLTEGTTITLGLSQPSTSGLDGELAIFRGTTLVASGSDAYEIPSGGDGTYYARVTAVGDTRGILSQYILSIDVADLMPPFVVGSNLPAEGVTINSVYDRFNVVFSEDMLASTVNSSASYDLREAGADGVFDTGDDVLYTVVPHSTYSSGVNASLRISDGPLQPGHYRFTATSALTDKVGNALEPEFVRAFYVEGVAPYVLESRSNESQATATPLAEPQAGPDGSFSYRSTTAVGTNPYHVASADLNGDGHADLVVANLGSDNVSLLARQRRRHIPSGSQPRGG